MRLTTLKIGAGCCLALMALTITRFVVFHQQAELIDSVAGTAGDRQLAAAEDSSRNGLILYGMFTVLDFALLLLCFYLLNKYVHYRDRAESEARRHSEVAEAMSRAKDQFIAVLSHELRTPLTPVLLTVSLLENHMDLSADVRADLQVIRTNVELQARLIDDLLDITRINNGKLQLRRQVSDLHQLIRNAIDTCRHDDGPADRVELNAADHHVFGDPARLQQILWNLLNNAHKFTPRTGTVTVRSYNKSGGIVVEVQDTGVGIDPDALPRLFNAFEQGGAETGKRFGGLGLGLAISKALILAQGGTLAAQSEGAGRGATFRIELPTVAADVSRPPGLSIAGEGEIPAVKRLKVLVVEDHAPTSRAMAKLLSRLGHEAETAATVGEAMEAAEGGDFDLIISDVHLPDGTGHELMQSVRRRRVKGIALSGYAMEDDVRKSMEAGFAEHLTKPVDVNKLKAAIIRLGR